MGADEVLRRLPQQGGHAPKVQGLLAIMPASSSQPARRLDLNLARQFSGWSRSTSATCQANWAPVAARTSQNGQSRPAAQPAEPNRAGATAKKPEIGKASGRERVGQYV